MSAGLADGNVGYPSVTRDEVQGLTSPVFPPFPRRTDVKFSHTNVDSDSRAHRSLASAVPMARA